MNPDKFQPENIIAFRSRYPHGENWVLSPSIKSVYTKKFDSIIVKFIPFEEINPE
jgi:hypothetical protein